MEVPELCATAEALIRAVAAPDLRDRVPVYIVAASAMSDKLLDPLTAACTSPHMCWALRDHLGDRWAGQGPAAVMSDGVIIREGGCAYVARFLGLALHEMAHALPLLKRIRRIKMSDQEIALYKAWALLDNEEDTAAQLDAKHADHAKAMDDLYEHHAPETFLRVLLHLRYRAVRLGFNLPTNDLVVCWDGCAPDQYAWLLQETGEFEALKDATVKEILKAPLPPKYAKQCQADRADFIARSGRN